MPWKQLFAKKSLDVLLAEMAGEHRLRRVLGPVTLSSLGIGAIIGTGIFVLTGVAARNQAGPGLVVSFVIAGLACAFAALCYAEFASMAPIAGSAYTYAYVSLGELIAWIIGWDLVLEYAMSSATVANGWAHYFLSFLKLFKDKADHALIPIAAWLAMDPFTAAEQHVDYQTARTLAVASATAVPWGASKVSLPIPTDRDVQRVSDVKVTFTADSVAAVRAFCGSDKEAETSIKRVRNILEDKLQYAPKISPAKQLEGIAADNCEGVDHQTARTLVVSSATAFPCVTLPVPPDESVERVSDVKVTFTADSLAAVRAHCGSDQEAEASVARVRQTMEDKLQYEPKISPIKQLEGIAGDNKEGHEAYVTTPLVIGPVHLTCNIVAIGIVAAISAILVLGIRESAGFNAAMVLVKVLVVLFVIVAGIGYIDTSNWSPFMPYGWWGVLHGASVIFFAYIGFDSVSTHAEEARNPKRDVPIGIISSLAVCTVLYIAVAAVVTGMIPYPQIPLNAPIAGVFEICMKSPAVRVIITVGALTGITSVLLVMLLSQPRVLLAMARDGLLPHSFFGAVHPRFRTPHKATILTGVVCALTASLFPIEGLSHMVNIGTLFAFVVVCSSVWLMRRLNPGAERPFRTPMMAVVAPSGVLLCLLMMVRLGWLNWLRLFIWLAAGLLIYAFYGRRHSHLGKELRGEIAHHGVSPAGVPLDGPGPETGG